MSHIVIIIDRAPPPPTGLAPESEAVSASVKYVVPHEATDAEVGQAVRKLVKQVRDLGA